MIQEYNRASEATSRLAEASRESSRALMDGAFAVQQQSMKLVLGGIFGSVETFEDQADTSRRMMRLLAEQSEKQQEALRTLTEESIKTYMDFLFAPFSHVREGPRLAAPEGETDGGLPIEGYDELTVEEISERVGDLSAEEVRAVRSYEERHKGRQTLLERLDRALA